MGERLVYGLNLDDYLKGQIIVFLTPIADQILGERLLNSLGYFLSCYLRV